MDNTTESTNLKQIYNLVDWIDFGLVIAVVIYYGRLVNNLQVDFTTALELDYAVFVDLIVENAGSAGIALLAASLAVCTTFICLTIMMRKKREIGIARATARIIWNLIWIPLDCYFLFMILFAR